jgi:hypothetical protein
MAAAMTARERMVLPPVGRHPFTAGWPHRTPVGPPSSLAAFSGRPWRAPRGHRGGLARTTEPVGRSRARRPPGSVCEGDARCGSGDRRAGSGLERSDPSPFRGAAPKDERPVCGSARGPRAGRWAIGLCWTGRARTASPGCPAAIRRPGDACSWPRRAAARMPTRHASGAHRLGLERDDAMGGRRRTDRCAMTDVRNPRLELVPLTLREANGCVERHHRRSPRNGADNPVAARRRARAGSPRDEALPTLARPRNAEVRRVTP